MKLFDNSKTLYDKRINDIIKEEGKNTHKVIRISKINIYIIINIFQTQEKSFKFTF